MQIKKEIEGQRHKQGPWVAKLLKFMQDYDYNQTKTAKIIGISKTLLQKYLFGDTNPRDKNKLKIIKAAKGFITLEDFDDLTNCSSCKPTKIIVRHAALEFSPIITYPIISIIEEKYNDTDNKLITMEDKIIAIENKCNEILIILRDRGD